MRIQGSNTTRELETFGSWNAVLSIVFQLLQLSIGRRLQKKSKGDTQIEEYSACIGFKSDEQVVDFGQETGTVTCSNYSFGMENHNIEGLVQNTLTFSDGEDYPPFLEYSYNWNSSSAYSEGWYVIKLRMLPNEKEETFPSWVKDVVIDTNIRSNRSDKKIDFILDNLTTPGILNSLKSLIKDNVKYVFDNSDGTKESLQLLEDYARVNTQLNLIDTGFDAWSLIRESIFQIIELITDYTEQSKIDRIEKRENEIKELLTDEEKLNRLIGDALNVGKSIQGYVVPYSESLGGYDFTRLIDISKNQDGKLWLSRQCLYALQYNWQFGEEF